MMKGTEQQDVLISRGSKKSATRWVVVVVCMALSLIIMWRWVFSFTSRATLVLAKDQVQIATVIRGDLIRDLAVAGRVVAANAPMLTSQVEGQIRFVKQPGEVVTKGEVLAVIDSPTLENELKQHQALLSSMKSELGRTQLSAREQQLDMEQLRNSAQVDWQAAQRNLTRAQQSVAEGVIRKIDYEVAKDKMLQAELELTHAKNKVMLALDKLNFERSAGNQLLARQVLVVEELERKLAGLQVKAPVAGQMGNWIVAQQSHVSPGENLLTVIDLSQYEVEISVPENYASELVSGLAVEITLNDEPLSGTLNSVASEVNDNSVNARVRFDQQDSLHLRQNQRLSARILFERKHDVLRVARGDFIGSGGGRSAYRVENNIAARIPVQLGAISAQWVEILSGVSEGDQLVISNVQVFKDADRVRLN